MKRIKYFSARLNELFYGFSKRWDNEECESVASIDPQELSPEHIRKLEESLDCDFMVKK